MTNLFPSVFQMGIRAQKASTNNIYNYEGVSAVNARALTNVHACTTYT